MSSCLLEKQILSSVDKNEGDTANEKGRCFFLVEGHIQWLKTEHFIKHQMLALFSGALFDWARAWGLTSSDSLPLFLSSLSL